jgi:hypothetical protein
MLVPTHQSVSGQADAEAEGPVQFCLGLGRQAVLEEAARLVGAGIGRGPAVLDVLEVLGTVEREGEDAFTSRMRSSRSTPTTCQSMSNRGARGDQAVTGMTS